MNVRITSESFVGHFVSAASRSCGKSIITMGLARLASQQSLGVQTFKKGPDYIDPLWLKAASSNSCYNLDPYLQSTEEWQNLYKQHTNKVVLVEGTMGLHDGLAVDGSDSNAAVAKALGIPVLLVVDCRGMHRTIAALVNGLTQFDSSLNFSGVILNRVRSDRHAKKIEQAIARYCDLPVLGIIAEREELCIDERELGLVPTPDHPNADAYLDVVANMIEATCDVTTLFQANLSRVQKRQTYQSIGNQLSPPLRIGIAQDEAFHFYYADDLDELRSRGVQLVSFSPLRDLLPPELDGLLLGGGFPERHGAELANNVECRKELASRIASGLPVRAECGGLMYLCQSIETDEIIWPMVGAIDGTVSIKSKPQGRGYMQLKQNNAVVGGCPSTTLMPAHEFHHSSIAFQSKPDCLYNVVRGYGIDGDVDGVCVSNVVASYAHFRHTTATPWIDWFLASVWKAKQRHQRFTHHV